MDFEQTYLTYKNLGHEKKFEQQPDNNMYNKEKAWYEKVKNKMTGEYYQAEDLIKRELVPDNWKLPHVDKEGKPVKYPIKYVSEIIRKKLVTDKGSRCEEIKRPLIIRPSSLSFAYSLTNQSRYVKCFYKTGRSFN